MGALRRHTASDYIERETGKPFEPVGLGERTNLQATEYDVQKGKPRPPRSVPPGTKTPPSSQAAIRAEAEKAGLPEPRLPKQEGPFPEEAGMTPEVAALYGRTMGRHPLERPSLWSKIKEGIKESFIPYHKIQGAEFAPVRDRLRILHGTQRNYREIASSQIEHILGPKTHFDARDYKLFSMKVFADELAESALRKGDSFSMPGVTKEEALAFARSEQARLEPFLQKNKAVREAYRRHLELIREVGTELAKRGLIKPELRQYYMHHQVLDFMREAYGGRQLGERFSNIKQFLESKPKKTPPGIREYRPGQLKERGAGVKDINRDYLRVMYEYLATTQEAIKRFDTLQEIIGLYDKSKEFNNVVPPGYAKYDFQKGFSAFRGENAVERMFGEALDGIMPELARTFGLDSKAATMLERQLMPGAENIRIRRDAIIPEQLSETLMEAAAARPKLTPVGRALEKGNRFFKNIVLHKMPFQYNIRNFNGDFQRALAQFGPGMFNMGLWKRSLQEVIEASGLPGISKGNKSLSPFMNYAQEYNITSSGRTATEISRVGEATQFQHLFRTPGENAPIGEKLRWIGRVATELLPRVSTLREDWMRVYLAKLNLERVAKGEPILPGVVNIKGLETEPYRAIAKVAREALGDYGNFTPFENKLRNGIAPFYSWASINLSFWPKLAGAVAQGAVSPGSAASGTLLKGFTMMVGMSLAARVWNDMVMEDAERALPKHIQESNHIVLPDPEQAAQGKLVPWVERDSRGKAKIMTVAVPDALDDFLSWTGMHGVTPELKHVFSGRMSWQEYLQRRGEDAIYKDGVPLPSTLTSAGNLLGPLAQVPVAAAGYQLFPDPFHPREILPGDKPAAIASAAGLSGIPGIGDKFPGVNIGLQGHPAKGIFDIGQQLGVTNAPGEQREDRFVTETRIGVERLNNEIQRVGSAMGRIKAEVSAPGLDEEDRANRVRQLELKRQALIGEIRRKVQRLNDLRARADEIVLP